MKIRFTKNNKLLTLSSCFFFYSRLCSEFHFLSLFLTKALLKSTILWKKDVFQNNVADKHLECVCNKYKLANLF